MAWWATAEAIRRRCMSLAARCWWRAAHAFGLIRGNPLQVFGSLLNLAVQLGLAGYLLWLRPWG